MKRPDYWDGTPPIWTKPLAALYTLGGALHRRLSRAKKMPVPVVSVGNAVAGGAGKTPTAIMIADCLNDAARTPHMLSRGYGAQLAAPIQVQPNHTAEQVGDEPLLLARHAPCWVYPRRSESAVQAVAAGADCLICDDAHQHHALHKDVRFLVIDGAAGIGNGSVHPAGPLREPFASALARTDAVIFIGPDSHHLLMQIPLSMPVFHGDIVPSIAPDALPQTPFIAFAGIARPEKFFDTLRGMGAQLDAMHRFADHHPFSALELDALRAEAAEKNARLVTTEKDWVRLPEALRSEVLCVPVALALNQPENFMSFLTKRLDDAA